MEGQSLWQEICQERGELAQEIDRLRDAGMQLARNEAEYKKALAKFIAMRRAENVPVTIIGDLARGNEEIANLRMQRDMSDVLYKVAQERINAIKLELRILQNQWEREWTRPEGA